MAAEEQYTFGKKATEQIAQTIREVSRRMMNETQTRARWHFHGGGGVEYAVILDDALAVATNSKTGATSCLATVCVWDASINDYVETATQKTVWNHSESTEYAIDTFGSARTIDGHLWFFGDCTPMASR